jgi:hypothetical protein
MKNYNISQTTRKIINSLDLIPLTLFYKRAAVGYIAA